jgi:peptidoglycan/LPS O-acetylase OafA/YrhL
LNPTQQRHLLPVYRADIDGLRAIAILSVVGFHAFPNWVAGGFIGVDMFFVISGFLISSILFRALDEGSFNSLEFYFHRIRRIFPALIVVLIFTHALGWFVLNEDDYKQLVQHIAAGAALIPNIFLWHQAGTISTPLGTEPLFHLWSLGIEAQFYFVWPSVLLSLWHFPKKDTRNFLALAVAAGVTSFVLCVSTTEQNHAAAYFSPLSRFWELMVGAVVAYIMSYRPQYVSHEASLCSLLGLGLIGLSLFFLDSSKTFPGWWTVLPTLGTYLIIAAGPSAWLNRNVLANQTLVWFGLISFPLYLWHWPLLSFLRIIDSDAPARALRISVVLISIFLAWITYELIEKPIRFRRPVPAKTVISGAMG